MNSLAYRHTMKKHKLGDFNVNLRSYAWFAKQISNLEIKKRRSLLLCYSLPSNLPWAQLTLDKKGKAEEKLAQYVSTCNSPVQKLEGEWLQVWAQ